jgi:hypothetical protein
MMMPPSLIPVPSVVTLKEANTGPTSLTRKIFNSQDRKKKKERKEVKNLCRRRDSAFPVTLDMKERRTFIETLWERRAKNCLT